MMPRIDATIHLGHVLQIVAIVVSVLLAMAAIGRWQAQMEMRLDYAVQRLERLEAAREEQARQMARTTETLARLDATISGITAALTRLDNTLARWSAPPRSSER